MNKKGQTSEARYQQRKPRLIAVGTQVMDRYGCVNRSMLRNEAVIHAQDYWMVIKVCEEMNWPKQWG